MTVTNVIILSLTYVNCSSNEIQDRFNSLNDENIIITHNLNRIQAGLFDGAHCGLTKENTKKSLIHFFKLN